MMCTDRYPIANAALTPSRSTHARAGTDNVSGSNGLIESNDSLLEVIARLR